MSALRADLALISGWVADGARLLDLGCGDGELLAELARSRRVTGYGLEIDPDEVVTCVSRGVNVIQQDIETGLEQFDDQSFDLVLMTQALQAVHRPDAVLREMARVGREAIVTFPNFGHWRVRARLALGGRMPLSDALPHAWYDTPNIHLCTVRDFETLCRQLKLRVKHRVMVNSRHRTSALRQAFPNLLGEIAVYRLQRDA